MPAGYSGTPLVRKLGIKAGMVLYRWEAPAQYLDLLGELPPDCKWITAPEQESADFIHAFFKEAASMEVHLVHLKPLLKKSGMLWISWPKKRSPLYQGLSREPVREMGLASGLVDTKVCAVDEDWSALKFVYRVKDR